MSSPVSDGSRASLSLFCLLPNLQPPPHHLLSAAQAHGHCLRVHTPRLQMVQLGDPSVHWWEALVGVCGQLSHPWASGWWETVFILEHIHHTYIFNMLVYICIFFYIKDIEFTTFCIFFPLPELTHEFLQILEKTPSRLKRIRNWRVKNPVISQSICDMIRREKFISSLELYCARLVPFLVRRLSPWESGCFE